MVTEVLVALASGVVGGGVAVYLARQNLRTEYQAEAAINQLLRHEKFKKRTFEAIKYRLPGFTDDELRKLLIRAGAIRIRSDQDEREGPYAELWGLAKKNNDAVNRDDGPPAFPPSPITPAPGVGRWWSGLHRTRRRSVARCACACHPDTEPRVL